jgi:hypothetical protein
MKLHGNDAKLSVGDHLKILQNALSDDFRLRKHELSSFVKTHVMSKLLYQVHNHKTRHTLCQSLNMIS